MSTEAQKRASAKYDREKIDRVYVRLPKGSKEKINQHIKSTSDNSLNGFVSRAIDETIERDKRTS